MIKFNLTVCLKPYIDKKTTDLRKKAEKDFEKDFFNLMNNAFGKIMENVRKREKTCHKKKLFGPNCHI